MCCCDAQMSLLVILLLAVAAIAQNTKFVFYDFFSGEWDVTHIQTTWKNMDLQNKSKKI
jgi:uncharacterized integral membrane protein